MEVVSVVPDLHRLDETPKEALACAIWSDERPFAGVAGLIDFRFAGRLSRLVQRRFISGKRGELLCVPGRPRLPFDKILILGMGERADFDEAAFRQAFTRIIDALLGLHVTSAAIELPGRADGSLPPERASEFYMEWAKEHPFARSVCLIEEHEAHKKFSKHIEELERRRRSL